MAPAIIEELVSAVSVPTKSAKPVEESNGHGHAPSTTAGALNAKPLTALSYGNVALAGIPRFDSVIEERRWQLEHMAAAFRHWAREGYVEGISGHISVRDPEHTDCFWTNPFGVHFGLLKVSDMVLVNLDGQVVGGNVNLPLNAAGFQIHAAIHRARPDVHAICHAHTVYGRAWSVFGRELDMLTQDACKFYKAHAVYDAYGGIVLGADEGNAIAAALGPHKACILRNHGLLTCGTTVDEAAFLFTAMEHACQTQLLCETAMASSFSSSSFKSPPGAAPPLQKKIIADEEAAMNFATDSTPDTCYAEFQPYYEWEDHLLKGEFKK